LLARLTPDQRQVGIHGLALLARAGSEQMEEQSKRKGKGRERLPS
jgi:hypothetical protein